MAIDSRKIEGNFTLRASAALPASGAYDTTANMTAMSVLESDWVELYITYTRGAAGGACQFKVLSSPDGGTTYFERTVEDGSSLSSGAMDVFTAVHKLPVAAGASAELRTYIVPVDTATHVKVIFAEYGNTGTPGTVVCLAAKRAAIR